ncbi:MAG: hypothetical protein ACF8AM_10795 [Rhodopirellula sp. JB055]|uniref:hypothetical protein n=1 Tax=Rhodopirellula sp. JB055 TaxID=3342846 RepID=UPI00370B523B
MKIQAKKWILAASVISTVAGTAVEAQACGGARRSGVSRIVSQIHSARTTNRYPSSTPRYSSIQPTYRQAPVYHNAPVSVQASPVASQSFAGQPVSRQPVSGQPFAPQQPVQQQAPVQQQVAVQQQTQTQPATQAAPSTQPAASAEASALAMLASINQRTTTPTQASGTTQTTTPAQSSAPATQPANTLSQIPTFGSASSASSVSSPAQPHVGSWNVSLPGEQSVSLELNSDGSFVWVASKSGSTSQFSGQYRLDGGSLTLVRSQDLQKMEGTWTPSQNGGFVFRVGGGTNGGLNFTRS